MENIEKFISRAIGFTILIGIIYFVASVFRPDPSPRWVPDDVVGYCTYGGDCF